MRKGVFNLYNVQRKKENPLQCAIAFREYMGGNLFSMSCRASPLEMVLFLSFNKSNLTISICTCPNLNLRKVSSIVARSTRSGRSVTDDAAAPILER